MQAHSAKSVAAYDTLTNIEHKARRDARQHFEAGCRYQGEARANHLYGNWSLLFASVYAEAYNDEWAALHRLPGSID